MAPDEVPVAETNVSDSGVDGHSTPAAAVLRAVRRFAPTVLCEWPAARKARRRSALADVAATLPGRGGERRARARLASCLPRCRASYRAAAAPSCTRAPRNRFSIP